MAKALQDPVSASQPLKQLFHGTRFQSFTVPGGITLKNAAEFFGDKNLDKANLERTESRLTYNNPDGTKQNIYRVTLADNKSVYVADFKPANGDNIRPVSLEIAGELISSTLLADWKGSRFQALRGWAQDYPSLKKADDLSGAEQKPGEEQKLTAHYVKWLSRALSLDAKDPAMTPDLAGFDPVKEQLGVLKLIMAQWRERGYQRGDSLHVKEVNETLRGLYTLFQDKSPVLAPTFDRTGVTTPLTGYSEAIKHPTIEYASAVYQSDDDFYNAFLALNAGFVRSDLFKARRDVSMPTTYPGLKLDVPADMLAKFGEWPVGVKQPRAAYVESNRQKRDSAIYRFQKFDGDKLINETRVNATTFQDFKKRCHPTMDLGEGSEGRYLFCDRQNPAKPYYHYLVTRGLGGAGTAGQIMVLNETDQLATIKRNMNRVHDGMPVTSTNTRGAITDHLSHFFTSLPTPLKVSAPDQTGLEKIKAFVSDKVNRQYIPAWADIGDPVSTPDVVGREIKIARFLMSFLEPLRPKLTDPIAITHLENLQDDHLAALAVSLEDKLSKRVFNLFHEAKHGAPDRIYETYRNEEDKYNRWKAELTSPTDTPEQVDAKMDVAMTEAREHADGMTAAVIPNHFERSTEGDPQVEYTHRAIEYVQRNTLLILAELASFAHNTKVEPFTVLSEAARYLEPKVIELVYNHTFEKFLTHFSLGDEKLPYLRPDFNLEFSDRRKELRMRLTPEDYLNQEAWRSLNAQQQQAVEVAVTERGTALDGPELSVLKHLNVAARLKDNDPENNYLERMLQALQLRAGQELTPEAKRVTMNPEDLTRMNSLLFKDMTPRGAQKILAAFGLEQAVQGQSI